MVRKIMDKLKTVRIAKEESSEPLPVLVYKQASIIRRKLGNTDLSLQENKAVNLSLAAPKINGILIRPGETFSFWNLVGRDDARHGYKKGLTIAHGMPSSGIGSNSLTVEFLRRRQCTSDRQKGPKKANARIPKMTKGKSSPTFETP